MAKTINQAAEDKKTVVAEVKRAGEVILIPENLTIGETIEVLSSKLKEEEQVVTLETKFPCFVWEGCYALAVALDKKFGWFKQMMTPGGFFSADKPPALMTVNIGIGHTVKVPWGRFLIPTIEEMDGFMVTGSYVDLASGMIGFKIAATIRRKHSRQFDELCDEVRKQLKAESIYKGKAIQLKFRNEDGDRIQFTDPFGNVIEFPEPIFPVVTELDPAKLVFNRDVEAQLNANLYTPIKKTARCRREGIPLKRGVLLAGDYGTGKTMVATLMTSMAVNNGWTFIFCQSAADFSECVNFAKHYQPAVVFCEDIDRIVEGERDASMDRILNTIDGVDAKGTEIVLVLTTNEVENIHQGMLRPGRLDAVIAMKRPDAEAVGRLMRLYGNGMIPEGEDLTAVGMQLAGQTPSVIREAVERAKLTALSLGDGTLELTGEALMIATQTMNNHLDLLNRKPKKEPHAMEILGFAVARGLKVGMAQALKAAPTLRNLPYEAADDHFEEESLVG